MHTTELLNRHIALITEVLNWWEEHKFDVCDRDHNVYDEEPDFVTSAKDLWKHYKKDENPHDWVWLR
tara:strand:- start:9 stop:209 length:201 start_codon:yes stop_codon:yes gene_type:complete